MLLPVRSDMSWDIQFSHNIGNMISTAVWWVNHTRLVEYFHPHVDTRVDIRVDIRVQPIFHSNTSIVLLARLWVLFFFFSPSSLQGALFNDVYQGFINYNVLLSLRSPLSWVTLTFGKMSYHVVASVEILSTLELSAKSPRLWACFDPLSPLSVVPEK